MASAEYEKLLGHFSASTVDASDDVATARDRLHAIHPTQAAPDVEVKRGELAGIPAAWIIAPEAQGSNRTVFMVHGGAFISTGVTHYLLYASNLSRVLGARVLVFEYRWAPEYPFPAALEDTLAVYHAALQSGLDPRRTAFVGDSCGGGIALAAMCALRDGDEPLPACWVGLTPWLDAEQKGDAAMNPRGHDPFVEAEWIRRRFANYAGAGGDARDPRISPIRAEMAGLPPLYFAVGEVDTTSDDSTRLAEIARGAGVSVELDVAPEMIHGYHGLYGAFPEATRGMERVGAFVKRVMGD